MSTQAAKDPDALPQLVGDFKPVDTWQGHVNTLFYAFRGGNLREYYQTFAVADYRLGFALAEDYWRQWQKRASDTKGRDEGSGKVTVMEWGSGNGNLAACFLDRLHALDTEDRLYSRLQYVCLEREVALLDQSRANPDLAKHGERVLFKIGSVEELGEFPDHNGR